MDEEVRRFDDHMDHVRGLALKTRGLYLRTVRRLLLEQFADRPVVISAIKPDDVRGFITRQSDLYSTPASTGTLASALRGYFRFRASRGDLVHGLIGVVCYPANWQLASLPKALSGAEVERLLGALGHDGPSARRAVAIVRCALDLGLRSSEIAKLGLDDIDWRAGTITLRGTKSRREDILPLPVATGRALVDYLRLERPQTTNRAVFVRHITSLRTPRVGFAEVDRVLSGIDQRVNSWSRMFLEGADDRVDFTAGVPFNGGFRNGGCISVLDLAKDVDVLGDDICAPFFVSVAAFAADGYQFDLGSRVLREEMLRSLEKVGVEGSG